MQKLFNNIVLILISGLLLFSTGGSLVILEVEEHFIEEEFEEELKKGKVKSKRTVTLTANELRLITWENSNEIKLNGKYYDLLSTTIEKGQRVYNFIADEEETNLFNTYANYHRKQHSSKTIKPFTLFAFFFRDSKISIAPNQSTYLFNLFYKALLPQSLMLPAFPPPKA